MYSIVLMFYLRPPSHYLLMALSSICRNTSYLSLETRIYASYFSGDMSSCLSSDDESRNTLQKYIGAERILPSMSKVLVMSYQFCFEFMWTFID